MNVAFVDLAKLLENTSVVAFSLPYIMRKWELRLQNLPNGNLFAKKSYISQNCLRLHKEVFLSIGLRNIS